MTGLMVVALLLVVLVKLRQRGKRKAALLTPLAGLDTGCRFGRRTPGRFFKPTRGY